MKGASPPGRKTKKGRKVFLVVFFPVYPKKGGSHDSHSNISASVLGLLLEIGKEFKAALK